MRSLEEVVQAEETRRKEKKARKAEKMCGSAGSVQSAVPAEMGKGVALEFKKRFPEMFDYERRCRKGEVHLGRPYLFKGLIEPWIINFPTKLDWRQSPTFKTS